MLYDANVTVSTGSLRAWVATVWPIVGSMEVDGAGLCACIYRTSGRKGIYEYLREETAFEICETAAFVAQKPNWRQDIYVVGRD